MNVATIIGSILMFVLVAGLLVLFCRGADDLDAWGAFVSRVLRGQGLRAGPERSSPPYVGLPLPTTAPDSDRSAQVVDLDIDHGK